MRFPQNFKEVLDRGETQEGLPMCIYETLDWIKIEELMWVRCPSLDKNEKALKGMSK